MDEKTNKVVVQVRPKKTIGFGGVEVLYKGETFTPIGTKDLIIRGAGARGKPPGEPGDIIAVPEDFYLRNSNFLDLVLTPAEEIPETEEPAKTPDKPATAVGKPDKTEKPGASISPEDTRKRANLELLSYADLKKAAKAAKIKWKKSPKKSWLIDEIMAKG